MTHWKINEIDETEEAISQRSQLMLVREFLLANDADDDLVDAIDVAIEDIEQHICPDIKAALEEGVLRRGNA